MNRLDKAKYIQEYVLRAEQILEHNDERLAEDFCAEVIAVFSDEIEGLNQNLTEYWAEEDVDYLKDTAILKAKLKNYVINIQTGFIKQHPRTAESSGTYIGINNDVSNQVSVNVSYESTISSVNDIPDDLLSQSDKEMLLGKLVNIETAQKNGAGKSKIWEKVKSVLSFLVDKGADAAIAVLPYLASLSQNLE